MSGIKLIAIYGDSVGSDTSPPKGGSVESPNAGKNKLKEKMDCLKTARDEKLKTLHAEIIEAVVAPNDSDDNASAGGEVSPQSKRPSPSAVDVKIGSVGSKKILKSVKKEKK